MGALMFRIICWLDCWEQWKGAREENPIGMGEGGLDMLGHVGVDGVFLATRMGGIRKPFLQTSSLG